MTVWKDEDALWKTLFSRLRGKWTKLEAEYPPGVSDSFGLWKGQTWWLEHKIGKPGRDALESGQIDFGFNCARHGVPWWVAFGYGNQILFFDHPTLHGGPKTPPFWLPMSEPLQGTRRKLVPNRISTAVISPAPLVKSIVRKPRKAQA